MRLAPGILALALLASPAATSVAGPRIAFQRSTTSGTATRTNVLTMRGDGTGVFALTRNRAPVLNTAPDWRPDHKRLVFASRRQSTANLWTVRANGDALTRLTHGDRLDTDPAWGAGGKRIAFARTTRPVGVDGSRFDVFSVHPDGSGLRKLTHGSASARAPDWSPDGRSLVFQRSSGGDPPQIWRMNGDGTHLKRLTGVAYGAYAPAWSPDGRLVAFAGPKGLAYEIFVASASGGSVRQGTDDRAGTFNDDPAWRPDSDRIVFSTSHSPPGGSNIAQIKPNGKSRRVLKADPKGQRVYGAPAWD
ncbi:MAG: TolB family protein [Thermoleophilaceae bacterium]